MALACSCSMLGPVVREDAERPSRSLSASAQGLQRAVVHRHTATSASWALQQGDGSGKAGRQRGRGLPATGLVGGDKARAWDQLLQALFDWLHRCL